MPLSRVRNRAGRAVGYRRVVQPSILHPAHHRAAPDPDAARAGGLRSAGLDARAGSVQSQADSDDGRLLAGRKVLVVGDLGLDEYVTGRTVRISREAPVLILDVVERPDR